MRAKPGGPGGLMFASEEDQRSDAGGGILDAQTIGLRFSFLGGSFFFSVIWVQCMQIKLHESEVQTLCKQFDEF